MAVKRDYLALEKKLARGKTLELAAEETGIPLEEARGYLDERRASSAATEDDALLLFSNEALRIGLNTLKRATVEKSRPVQEGQFQKDEVIDIDAAKALLRAGLDARKMLGRHKGAGGSGGMPPGPASRAGSAADDLWDFKKTD